MSLFFCLSATYIYLLSAHNSATRFFFFLKKRKEKEEAKNRRHIANILTKMMIEESRKISIKNIYYETLFRIFKRYFSSFDTCLFTFIYTTIKLYKSFTNNNSFPIYIHLHVTSKKNVQIYMERGVRRQSSKAGTRVGGVMVRWACMFSTSKKKRLKRLPWRISREMRGLMSNE